MTLVNYSDSEPEELDANDQSTSQQLTSNGTLKRKADVACDVLATSSIRPKLPPLPTAFHSLYATNVRASTNDDPSLHGGRKRQIPHAEGQWPSHVYLEWFPTTEERINLAALISQAESQLSDGQRISPFFRSALGVQLPLHISLSAPLSLSTAVKDEFLSALIHAFSLTKATSFQIELQSLDWVSNFDRTRWFLIIRLRKCDSDELGLLVKSCNAVCKRFDQPLLYRNGLEIGVTRNSKRDKSSAHVMNPAKSEEIYVFHISIGWVLKEPSPQVREAVSNIKIDFQQNSSVSFDRVKIKIGNNIEDVHLTQESI